MVAKITLTDGLIALVDDEDFDLVGHFSWRTENRYNVRYAIRTVRTPDTRSGKTTVLMHRMILGLRRGDPGPDHINRNGLDNRRENLRSATLGQNRANAGPEKDKSSSGYKGVFFHRKTGLWTARLTANGRNFSGRYHKTPEEAARAYDQLAKEVWGEFAYLNFPEM